MNSSLRLLLEEFLGLMREEGELDAFLPLLLSAMGHQIVTRPQKGPRQKGVDLATVGIDEADGRRKYFMWVLKRGTVGRQEWNSGQFSVRQSLDDIVDDYLPTHIRIEFARLPRKVVVLTNGDYASTIAESMANHFRKWTRRNKVPVVAVNGSGLAEWTEKHLLDENLLPKGVKSHLRRMLANVSTTELCVESGKELVTELVDSAKNAKGSAGTVRKARLTGLRALRTAVWIVWLWGTDEGNMKPAYRIAEYAVLAVWAAFHKALVAGEMETIKEFHALLTLWQHIAATYHVAMQPYYVTSESFGAKLPDAVFAADAAFQELGRLALQTYYMANIAVESGLPELEREANACADILCTLLNTQGCLSSPIVDDQAVDIHVGLLALLATNRREFAVGWLEEMVDRLEVASTRKEHWPLSADVTDVLSVRWEDDVDPGGFIKHTTLVPVLAVWASTLGLSEQYARLWHIHQRVKEATPNLWTPTAGHDSVLHDAGALSKHGIAETFLQMPQSADEYRSHLRGQLGDAPSISSFSWYQARLAVLPLLSAMHCRRQVPREMLLEHALALSIAPLPDMQ